MAPTLTGYHRQGPCPRCGYPVRVGRPASGKLEEHYSQVTCPNCGECFSLLEAPDINGDRLLVDKNVYSLRTPRRWEIVVFRCPDDDPKEAGKPYVKRIVGLPGETISIRDGDVYVNGEIARKGLAVMRELLIPIFDMRYSPRSGNWSTRWLAVSNADPRLPANRSAPASTQPVFEETALVLDATSSPQAMAGATYRNWNLTEQSEEIIRAWNAYDGAPRQFGQLPAVHDFFLTCEVEVTQALPGTSASFACRLMDGADAISAELHVGAKESGRVVFLHENHGEVSTIDGVALEVGRRYKVEFAFVDRRVCLAVNGKLVLPPYDLPNPKERGEVSRPLQLGVRGCKAVIRDLVLSRDVYYTHYGTHGTRQPARLGPDAYFVLGDNSGNSQDSRKWSTPGVPETDFIGKPFLIHQPLRIGRVSIGGRERVFQTIDWSRLRWLH